MTRWECTLISNRLFESGSIMQYLVDRYDSDHKISFPHGTREQIEMTNWLFFMNAGVGQLIYHP